MNRARYSDEPRQKAGAQKVVVLSDDIGSRAEIHGKLGLPLGRLMTIQGRCLREADQKEYSGYVVFRVAKVNGKGLDRLIEIPVTTFGGRADSIKVERTYELRGYEHGQFRGIPNDAYQEYVRDGKPHFATSTGYHFETEFALVSARPL